MKFEILLSCMNQKNMNIIKESNINCATLIINQCDNNDTIKLNKIKMINTIDRGLSKSRNLALRETEAEICLLADDDEVFVDNVEKLIINAYKKISDADLIIFKMTNYPSKLGRKERKLKKLDLLRISSWQISFKIKSIRDKNIKFDEKLGAGTGNGSGEENEFLLKCYSHGLNIYYVPLDIAKVAQEESTWFKGYTEEYFFNRGRTIRYILGKRLGALYNVYFCISKYKIYKKDSTLICALKNVFKGMKCKL